MRVAAATLALAVCALPSGARAESFVWSPDAADCDVAGLRPGPMGGAVPANQPRFTVAPAVRMHLEDAMTRDPVDADDVSSFALAILVPRAPLTVGGAYDLVRDGCPERIVIASYTVTAERPLPTSLGSIEVSPLRAWFPTPGSPERDYYVNVSLTVDPALSEWVDAYDWWVERGDATTSGLASLYQTTLSRVAVRCETSGMAEIDLTGRAGRVPYVAELATSAVTRSDVCADAVWVDPFDDRELTPAEIAALEASWTDAAMRADAASAPPDAGSIDGGSAGMPTEPDTNPNCGCAASGRHSLAGWSVVGLVAGVVARRIRRRPNPTR